MFVYVRVPESQSPKHHGNFLKKPCLAPNISETIELNQKGLKNLLTNVLCSFQIRKDPLSDIGTLNISKVWLIFAPDAIMPKLNIIFAAGCFVNIDGWLFQQ